MRSFVYRQTDHDCPDALMMEHSQVFKATVIQCHDVNRPPPRRHLDVRDSCTLLSSVLILKVTSPKELLPATSGRGSSINQSSQVSLLKTGHIVQTFL